MKSIIESRNIHILSLIFISTLIMLSGCIKVTPYTEPISEPESEETSTPILPAVDMPSELLQPISPPQHTGTADAEEYEAYKRIEAWLNWNAKSVEAQRYLADFMDLTRNFWGVGYEESNGVYQIEVTMARDIPPNTYYYRPFWTEVMWILSTDGHISPDANARRLQADMMELNAGGVIELNPNYSP